MLGLVSHLLMLRRSAGIRAEDVTRSLHGTVDCTEDRRSIGMREHRRLRCGSKPSHQLHGIGPVQSITDFVQTIRPFLNKIVLFQNPTQRGEVALIADDLL